MRKPKKQAVTITVRVRPEISNALDSWSVRNGYYVYEAVEKLLEAGLEAHGTSVDQLTRKAEAGA